MTKYDLILCIIYDIVLISKEFEKFTNKRHIYSNTLNQKETITNSNKLYRWGKIYVLQCRLMLLQQLKIKLEQVFLAAKGKKIGGGNSAL